MADGDITAGIRGAALAPTSPLDTVSKVVGIGNEMTRNKLMNQQVINAQQELLNQQQTQKNLELTNQQGQFNLQNAAVDRNSAAVMGMLSKTDDELTGQGGYDTAKAAMDQELARHPNSPQAAQVHQVQVASIPPPFQPDGTPTPAKVYRQFAYQNGQIALSARERMAVNAGPLQDVGGQIVVAPSEAQRVANPGSVAPLTKTLTPGERTDILTVRGPDGHDVQVTRQQLADQQLESKGYKVTNDPRIPAQPAPGQQPPAPAQQPVPGAPAQQPAPGQQPPAPAQPAPGQQPPLPGQPAPAQPAPGQPKIGLGQPLPSEGEITLANTSRAKDSADMAQLTSRNFNNMQGSLNSIRNLSPGVDSGKGTDLSNTVKQILTNAMPNVAAGLGIDPNKSMDQQDLWKALSNAAQANGNRSDADLFASMHSNPNQEMSPKAMQRAAGYILALNDQESVLTQEAHAQSTHKPMDLDSQNAATRLRVQNGTDQNAYRLRYSSPEERAAYVKSLKTDEAKQKYLNTLKLMDKYAQTPAGMTPTVSQ